MKKFLLIISALLVSACTVKENPNKTTITFPGGYKIETEGNGHSNSNGKFCPPGQAKKGRC